MSTYPRTGLQRILSGAPDPVLRATILDQDGDPVAVDIGTVTCTITRADGTVIATDRAATDSTSAVRCQLTTEEALTLDVLTAVWKVAGVVRHTSHHRIVGGFMFSITELAGRAGVQPSNDLATLRTERERITDMIESLCGAQSPRYDLEHFIGSSSLHHVTEGRPIRSLRSVTIDNAERLATLFDLEPDAGIISGLEYGLPFYGPCTVGYEHGLDNPAADLRDAAITAAADSLLRRGSTLGPRVRSATNDAGITQTFSFAGDGHPTGIDEVDAVIMRHAKPQIGIA